MMTSAQVVETSVNTSNSPSQDYTTNPDDHSNDNKPDKDNSRMEANFELFRVPKKLMFFVDYMRRERERIFCLLRDSLCCLC